MTLAADVSFLGAGTDPHRKACLMIRQSLDADSAYVDVALHGDGLTSLQFREAKGAATHEVQANVSAPGGCGSRSAGKYALMYLAAEGGEPQLLRGGGADRVRGAVLRRDRRLRHNKDVVERAVFSNVELIAPPVPAAPSRPVLYSTLETQTIASTDRRVVHVTPRGSRRPTGCRDGKTLIYNSGGRI